MIRLVFGRDLTTLSLLIWAASFFLPVFANDPTNWVFAGKNLGYEAALMSMMALYMVCELLRTNPSHLAELGYYFYFGSLCIANVLMVAAPFAAPKIRKRQGLSFLILYWTWVALAVPAPHFFHGSAKSDQLEVGFFVWLLSLVTMAIALTRLYLSAPKSSTSSSC